MTTRRKFLGRALTASTSAAGLAAVASPAVAQEMPSVKWRCVSSFPKNLEVLFAKRASDWIADKQGKLDQKKGPLSFDKERLEAGG